MPLDFLLVINNSAWGRLTDFIELKRNKLEGWNQLIRTEPSKTSSSTNKSFLSLSLSFAEGKPQKGVTYPSALTYSSPKSPTAKAGKCS